VTERRGRPAGAAVLDPGSVVGGRPAQHERHRGRIDLAARTTATAKPSMFRSWTSSSTRSGTRPWVSRSLPPPTPEPIAARPASAADPPSQTGPSNPTRPGSVVPRDQTATTSTRSSRPTKSSAFRVYSRAVWAWAVAAIRRSIVRARGCRPAATTAAASCP